MKPHLDLSAGRAPAIHNRAKVFRFRGIDFFVDKGVIHFIDRHTGKRTHARACDLRERLWAFQQALGRMVAPDLYRETIRLLDDGALAMGQIRQQGDPFCPVAARQMMLKRPARISLSGRGNFEVNSPTPTKLIIPGG